jgi:hypothetical protein
MLFRAAMVVVALLVATTASAQIVQSIHIGAGRFFPRGFDSRNKADTLVADLTVAPTLAFDISEFRALEFFIEWNMQIGNRFEIGAGLSGFRSPRVLSAYRFPVNGRNAGQMLRLSVVPVVGVVRYFPLGTPQSVQPFVGAGVGGARWKYSESGEFFDPSDNTFFTDNFEARGGAPARVMLFGIRVPGGGGKYAFNFEWRYQYGVGRTGGLQAGFLGEKFDLGGGTIRIGYMGRF